MRSAVPLLLLVAPAASGKDAEKEDTPGKGAFVKGASWWHNLAGRGMKLGGDSCDGDSVKVEHNKLGQQCLAAHVPGATPGTYGNYGNYGECTAPGACSWCGTWAACCKAGETSADGECDGNIGGRWPPRGNIADSWYACVCKRDTPEPTGRPTQFPTSYPGGCAWSARHDGCLAEEIRFKSYPGSWVVQECKDMCRACSPCVGDDARITHYCTAISLGPSGCWLSTATTANNDVVTAQAGFESFYDCEFRAANAPPPSSMSGDPFVTDSSGKKVQIFLPLQEDTMLLRCQNFKLYARAVGSGVAGDHQQWFDRIRIVRDDAEQLAVEAKQPVVNAAAPAEGYPIEGPNLTTINVAVDGEAVHRTGASFTGTGALIAIYRNGTSPIPGGFTELVSYAMGSSDILIKSSRVNKDTATQKVHLDLEFTKFKTVECGAGPLAEIWGVVPLSHKTAEMLKPHAA